MSRTHSPPYPGELHHGLDTSRHHLQMIFSHHYHQDHPLLAHLVTTNLHHRVTTVSLTVATMVTCSTKGILHTATVLVRTTMLHPQRIRSNNNSDVARDHQGVAGVEDSWEGNPIVIAMDHSSRNRIFVETAVCGVHHQALLVRAWATMLYVDEREICCYRRFGEHVDCMT